MGVAPGLVFGGDHHLDRLALRSGFAATEELSGTTWMDAGQRPPVAHVEGFSVVDRTLRKDRPHPMIACNSDLVEGRLRRCSPYDPTLDLTVEDAEGKVAGYALFWFDPATLVGLVEPMRVEDDYQRTQPLRRGRLRPDICRPTLRPASTARTVGLTGPSRRIDDHRRGSPQLPGRNGSSEEDTRWRRQSGGTRGESTRALGEPLRHRRLDRAPDAVPPAHRQAAGRVDPIDYPGPSVRPNLLYDVSVTVAFLGGADFDCPSPLGTTGWTRYFKVTTVEEVERLELLEWLEEVKDVEPGSVATEVAAPRRTSPRAAPRLSMACSTRTSVSSSVVSGRY